MMEIHESDNSVYDSNMKLDDKRSDLYLADSIDIETTNNYFGKQQRDDSAEILMTKKQADKQDGTQNGTQNGTLMSDHFKHFSQSIRHFLAAVKPIPSDSEKTAPRPSADEMLDVDETVRERPTAPKSTARRVRCRRNPVWQYFSVDNGLAICQNCEYSTRSVFSTNLKVHLRSHHLELYELVRKAEEQNEAGSSKLSPNNSNANPASPISTDGKSDCDSAKNSRPPTRGDLSSANADIVSDTSQQQQRSVIDAFPSLTTNHFFQHNIMSTNLESVLRGVQLNATNLFGSPLANTDEFAQTLAALSKAGSSENGGASTVATLSVEDSTNVSFIDDALADGVRQTKRRRLRRHPVWRFFTDVDEKTVGCAMCNFKTRSAFSTNLKMHLRAHHKVQYLAVMEAELEQCNLEGSAPGDSASQLVAEPLDGAESGGLRRIKRKRKSVEEIQGIINKCKVNLAKERQRRGSVDLTTARIDENVAWLPARQTAANCSDALPSSAVDASGPLMTFLQALHTQSVHAAVAERKPLIASQLFHSQTPDASDVTSDLAKRSSIEQLNSMIGATLKNGCANDNNNNNNGSLNNNSVVVDHQNESSAINVLVFSELPSQLTANGHVGAKQLDDIRRLFEFCNMNKNEGDRLLRSVVMKQATDLVLKRIVDDLGSSRILNLPSFRLLVSALAPDYDWSHVDA